MTLSLTGMPRKGRAIALTLSNYICCCYFLRYFLTAVDHMSHPSVRADGDDRETDPARSGREASMAQPARLIAKEFR